MHSTATRYLLDTRDCSGLGDSAMSQSQPCPQSLLTLQPSDNEQVSGHTLRELLEPMPGKGLVLGSQRQGGGWLAWPLATPPSLTMEDGAPVVWALPGAAGSSLVVGPGSSKSNSPASYEGQYPPQGGGGRIPVRLRRLNSLPGPPSSVSHRTPSFHPCPIIASLRPCLTPAVGPDPSSHPNTLSPGPAQSQGHSPCTPLRTS